MPKTTKIIYFEADDATVAYVEFLDRQQLAKGKEGLLVRPGIQDDNGKRVLALLPSALEFVRQKLQERDDAQVFDDAEDEEAP